MFNSTTTDMNEEPDETIIKMVTNLKPNTLASDLSHFDFHTPLKRSLSANTDETESSLDEPLTIKKIKFDKRFDFNYMGSPREIRRLRADLLEARNTILNLESRIQHMHSIRKEMQVMFDNETKSFKKEQEHSRKSIEDLENQLQSIRKRECELKDELSEMKNKYHMLKIRKDEEIEELEKSICEMRQESRLFEGEESSEITSLQRKLAEMQMVLEATEDDAEAQKKLVRELEKQLSEKSAIERNLEMKEQALQNAKLKIKELEYAKENFLEYQERAKTQAYKLANYFELERENDRLKSENVRLKEEVRNKLLLEEEVYDLKCRLINSKEQDKKLANLQVQQVQTEMLLSEWRAVARGICESTGSDSSLPHLLRSAVERLQQQEINLTSAKVEIESQLNNALHEAKVAKSELEKNLKLVNDLKKTGEQKQLLIHRMQKKLLLVSRERDSYRLQLDSYEKDLTMCINPNQSNQLQNYKERIDNLEQIIESYRDMIAKLEGDLQNLQPHLYQEAAPTRAEQLNRLQDEIDALKLENEMLRTRRDQLEIQLENFLIGHDSLQGGQVYHFTKNPLADCLAEREQFIEKQQQEVERLKRKIKNLEDGLESSKLTESIICPQDLQALKDQIKTHDVQTQRLKDYFKSSMQEFRNVIYMLFGYKIDRTSTQIYKLTNMYAERAEDQLCFQLNSEGAFNLLESEFSATLEDMVTLHLRHQKSIPVFLSAITMDLFNSLTNTNKNL